MYAHLLPQEGGIVNDFAITALYVWIWICDHTQGTEKLKKFEINLQFASKRNISLLCTQTYKVNVSLDQVHPKPL